MTRNAAALRAVGVAGGAVAAVLFVTAITMTLALGWNLYDAVESYSLGNSLIGASLSVCGTILARSRPRHPLGWLLLGSGIAYGLSGAATPVAAYSAIGSPLWLSAQTLSMAAWPLAIGLGIPFVLLLFPEGKLVGRIDRLLAVLAIVAGVGFVVSFASFPLPGNVFGYANWMSFVAFWTVLQVVSSLVEIAIIVRLVVRAWRSGDERLRRQVQWLALAVLVALVVSAPLTLFQVGDNGQLIVFVLVPIAILVGVLRYRLLDITFVFSRALAWTLLTAATVLAYVGLVALLGTFLQTLVSATVVAVIVALAFDPLRRVLQRLVDRLLYGRRSEPVHVLRLVTRGASEGSALTDLLQRLADSLKLPWLSLQAGEMDAVTVGRKPTTVEELRLVLGDSEIGRLLVGVRSGQAGLARADLEVLDAIAPVLALLARTTGLASDLSASRRRIVDAQEAERLRVQRELHDGVASAITGLSFRLEATQGETSAEQLHRSLAVVRSDVDGVLASLRAVMSDLRPPELDSVGLVAALQRRTSSLGEAPRVEVIVDGDLTQLPPSVETAAFRIGTEAVSNALRHSGGDHVVLRLALENDDLLLTVRDDGRGISTASRPGIGLASMRERAEVLGGTFIFGDSQDGGAEVRAVLPLGAH